MRLTLTNVPATRAFIRALIAAAIIDALAGGRARLRRDDGVQISSHLFYDLRFQNLRVHFVFLL